MTMPSGLCVKIFSNCSSRSCSDASASLRYVEIDGDICTLFIARDVAVRKELSAASPSPRYERVLPLRPKWFSLVFNSVSFAAILWRAHRTRYATGE